MKDSPTEATYTLREIYSLVATEGQASKAVLTKLTQDVQCGRAIATLTLDVDTSLW